MALAKSSAAFSRFGAAILVRRPTIDRPPDTRDFLDRVLGDLRAEHFSLGAWARFGAACTVRSWQQCLRHPVALSELVAAHCLLATIRRTWLLPISFLLCATHLGLLGERDRLGAADPVSLLRATLPIVLTRRPAWAGAVALATDALDGPVARRTRSASAFGAYLDALADVIFWTWFSRAETAPWLRRLALAVWPAPAAAITAAYFMRGRPLDYPRLTAARWISAAMQVALAGPALVRSSWFRAAVGSEAAFVTRVTEAASPNS